MQTFGCRQYQDPACNFHKCPLDRLYDSAVDQGKSREVIGY
jgi:hypothetical protein